MIFNHRGILKSHYYAGQFAVRFKGAGKKQTLTAPAKAIKAINNGFS